MPKSTNSIMIYAMATALVSGSNFLSAPLLIRLLGVQGFTQWSLIEPVMLVSVPLAGLGIQIGLLNEIRKNPKVADHLFPWHALFCLIIAAALTSAMLLLGWSMAMSMLTGAAVLAEGAITFLVSFWRGQNKPMMYAVLEGMRTFTLAAILGSLVLVLNETLTVDSYLLLRFGIGASFLALGIISARVRWLPDRRVVLKAIEYGLPIVLASAIVSAFLNFDRYFVVLFAGEAPLASYVGHIKVVQILGSALSPFYIWLAPIAIGRIGAGSTKDGIFASTFYGFVVVNAALSVGLWLIAPTLWPILFPQMEFSHSLFLINIAGMAAYSCGNPLSIGTLKEGNTKVAIGVTLIACIVGFIVMGAAGSKFGAEGVALGKMTAMIVYPILFALHTNHALSISYPWKKVVAITVFSVGVAIAMSRLTATSGEVLILGIAMAGSLLVVLFGYAIWRIDVNRCSSC